MKERPILFSGEMVRAVLEGRKTQTRRVIKGVATTVNKKLPLVLSLCKFGKPGDRLWVREKWRRQEFWDRRTDSRYSELSYAADCTADVVAALNWKPSIHMRRADSRIDLEITNVRVERLQDITHEDAKAEGVEIVDNKYHTYAGKAAEEPYRFEFIKLWESLNQERGFSWYSNPWVWVIEFKKI